jgi:hypothetical protein
MSQERCPDCGSAKPSERWCSDTTPAHRHQYMHVTCVECQDAWHTAPSPQTANDAAIYEEAFGVWTCPICETSEDTKEALSTHPCKSSSPIAAVEAGAITTGFEVTIRTHTKEAQDAITSPEALRFMVGHMLDSWKISEEIDYTLEVRRIYE